MDDKIAKLKMDNCASKFPEKPRYTLKEIRAIAISFKVAHTTQYNVELLDEFLRYLGDNYE